MKLLSLFFVCILKIAVVLALTFTQISHAEESIESICQRSALPCINQVNKILPTLKERSRLWYSLVVLKMEAMHSLQQVNELYQLTSAWLDESDLPVNFQANVFIYYAKASYDLDKKAQAIRYVHKAKEHLSLINQAYPSPKLVLELASLQSYLDDQTESYKSLVELEKQYRDRATPYYQVEIYGHLGHSARKLGYLDKELLYWRKAVEWAYSLGYDRQIAITLYNYGQAQQKSKLLHEAWNTYQTCIKYAEKANNQNKVYQAKLHLVELALLKNNKKEAKQFFNEVQIDNLAQRFKDRYHKLQRKL